MACKGLRRIRWRHWYVTWEHAWVADSGSDLILIKVRHITLITDSGTDTHSFWVYHASLTPKSYMHKNNQSILL